MVLMVTFVNINFMTNMADIITRELCGSTVLIFSDHNRMGICRGVGTFNRCEHVGTCHEMLLKFVVTAKLQ